MAIKKRLPLRFLCLRGIGFGIGTFAHGGGRNEESSGCAAAPGVSIFVAWATGV